MFLNNLFILRKAKAVDAELVVVCSETLLFGWQMLPSLELSFSLSKLIVCISVLWGASLLGDFLEEPGKWRTWSGEVSNWISSDTKSWDCWGKRRKNSKEEVTPGLILLSMSLAFAVQQNLISLTRGDCLAGSLLMSVVTSFIFPSRKACSSRVSIPITQYQTEVDTICASCSAELVSTGRCCLVKCIN